MEYYEDDYGESGDNDLRAAMMNLVWQASRGQAMLEAQYENSGEAAGNRILDAHDRMQAVDLWGDDGDSWIPRTGAKTNECPRRRRRARRHRSVPESPTPDWSKSRQPPD